MKLAAKLSLAMGTLVVLIVGLGVFCLMQMNGINQASTIIAGVWLPKVIILEEMNTATSDYRIQQLQHVVAQDKATMDIYGASMRDLRESVEGYIAAMKKYSLSPEGLRMFNKVQELWAAYLTISGEVKKLSEGNHTEKAMDLLNGEGKKAYDVMCESLLELVELGKQGATAASEAGDESYASSRAMVLGLIVLAILLAVGVALYIIRNTLNQLGKDPGELAVLAKDVAGGNLDIEKDARAVGVYAEILTMVDSLKQSIESARQESERAQEQSRKAQEAMVAADAASKDAQAKRDGMLAAADRLEEVAGVVSSASTELSAQIEQSERGATEQAARVTETATAMEEMNSTVMEVAKNAGNASDVSATTRRKAEQGAAVVQEAVVSINSVQEASLALKEDMAALSEQAQSISQIMAVISDIADQTNLLALNAAIEAARAGDAGRGFAVVADEVRNLAEKTMASTTDVGNAIKAIQDSAAKSMAQVDSTVANIEKATELATRSGQALEEIVTMVDSTADQVRGIATASEQQSASSEEINRSIAEVNTIASETARAMEEAARAVSDLAGQAQVLSSLIDDMKRA